MSKSGLPAVPLTISTIAWAISAVEREPAPPPIVPPLKYLSPPETVGKLASVKFGNGAKYPPIPNSLTVVFWNVVLPEPETETLQILPTLPCVVDCNTTPNAVPDELPAAG